MKYRLVQTHQFKKSLRKILKSGHFNEEKLKVIISCLAEGKELSQLNKDHSLQGDWAGYRECHIESDVLLIYRVSEELEAISLSNIGSHSYLFGV